MGWGDIIAIVLGGLPLAYLFSRAFTRIILRELRDKALGNRPYGDWPHVPPLNVPSDHDERFTR